MRHVLIAAVMFGVLTAGPAWAQNQIDTDRKLITAAAITLAAYIQQGGTINIQSSSSALLERYGLHVRKDAECVYTVDAGTSDGSRRYTVNFRNLTGNYSGNSSELVFQGTSKPPVCFKDADGSGMCAKNLVISRPINPDRLVNNVLYVLKNGCSPSESDLPGNTDPY